MKISADPNHEAYSALASSAKVFLNGEELHYCMTADEERGEVVCYVFDENNKLVVHDDELVTETIYGQVEIRV